MHCPRAATSGTSTCKTQGGPLQLQQAHPGVSTADHSALGRAHRMRTLELPQKASRPVFSFLDGQLRLNQVCLTSPG